MQILSMCPFSCVSEAERLWLLQAVQLALGCLSFDFVGTCLDESAEDLGTIQARPCLPPAHKPPTSACNLCRNTLSFIFEAFSVQA